MSQVRELAVVRSGDKGNHANIGVVARSEEAYDVLRRELTPQRVADYFASLDASRIVRYEMPNVLAFNFLLYDVLAGGASRSLRFDTQGKLLGTALMEMEL
jgi:hypothetical protein